MKLALLIPSMALCCFVPLLSAVTPGNPEGNAEKTLVPAATSQGKNFLFPGIVRYEGGEAGGDHLIGLGRTIGIGVELHVVGNDPFPLKAEELQKAVQGLFQEYRLNTTQGPPYLPFFDIVIVIAPVPKGYAAHISGRLFEKVQLRELRFDPSIAWQAITWEKESFQVLDSQDAHKKVQETVMEIVKAFVDRVAFFESLPQQEPLKYIPVAPSTTSVPRIKESNPKLPPPKPIPTDFKKKKEELLNQIRK